MRVSFFRLCREKKREEERKKERKKERTNDQYYDASKFTNRIRK